MIPEKCCKKCGNVTYYGGRHPYYECMKMKVSPWGVCDRFQKNCSSEEIMRKLDKAMSRIEKVEPGCYVIRALPNYGQNYRLQEIAR